tara:strand:- start:7188 stop:7499 length:312 start_codon:yes stop_codon:yes gene_type:complete
MNIPKIILNNAKLSGDSFVNDQLKWRRERIEDLTKDLAKSKELVNTYKTAYKNECDFVKQLRDLYKFTLDTLKEDMGEIPNADKLLSTIDKHVQSNDNFFNKK